MGDELVKLPVKLAAYPAPEFQWYMLTPNPTLSAWVCTLISGGIPVQNLS